MSIKSNEAQSAATQVTESNKHLSPHDRFVQSVLEIHEVALSFFQAYLPPKLVQAINWSTLAIYDTARRRKGKNTSYTDITYQAQVTGVKGELLDTYLHLEHQRTIDYDITSRMYDYNSGLLLKYEKQGHLQQPLVVNLVLYNGVSKNHPDHQDPYECFDDPELVRCVLGKPYVLVNLNKMSDQELLSHGACGLMEVLLKRANKANFVSWLEANCSLLRSHASVPYLKEIVLYCLEVADADADKIIEALASIDPNLNEPIMRAVQQIEAKGRQEGIQKGMQEGMQEGRQEGMQKGMQKGMQTRSLEIARNMFQAGEPIERVARWTGLSEASIRSL